MAALARSTSSIQKDLFHHNSIETDPGRLSYKQFSNAPSYISTELPESYIPEGSGQNVTNRQPDTSSVLSPRARKAPRYSHMALKGSDAIAEQRRHHKEKTREESLLKSPNPSAIALKALMGEDKPLSSARDGPFSAATSISEPVLTAAKATSAADSLNVSNDTHADSNSLSAVGGAVDAARAPTSITVNDAAVPAAITLEEATPVSATATSSQQGPSSDPTASAGDDNNSAARSFTFPPPLGAGQEHRGPSRGLSMPTAGYGHNSPRSSSVKRHKCPYCSTDFTRHHNLKSHLLTHSQEKPYECPTCGAKFRRLHDLKRHTKLHTGERPHTCPRCGRRFARGDALARHNKGQGGCPGRRSSFGDTEFAERRSPGENMVGILHQPVEDVDEDRRDIGSMGVERRRVFDSGQKHFSGRNHTMSDDTGAGDHGIYRPHSNTYPPLNSRLPGSDNRSLFPHSSHSNASPVPTAVLSKMESSSSSSINRREPGSMSMPSTQFGPGQASMFAHGGMTESPKPLSPGQAEVQHKLGVSETGSMQHSARSPSMPQQVPHAQHYVRPGTGSVTSPIGLHPPSGSPHPPQLPSLPGLEPTDLRSQMTNKLSNSQGSGSRDAGPGSNVLHQRSTGPSPTSNPGNLSGHGYGPSSAGSMRDTLGGGSAGCGSRDVDMWSYIRELETKFTRMQDEYENRVLRLHEEVGSLRSQLLQQHQQQQQQQQHHHQNQNQQQQSQPQPQPHQHQHKHH